MADIKIFVSHRIDKDAKTIDNGLYIPVRCGAVFDKRENMPIIGDNTGENISERRESFCELTVLYWAWKNQKADYYGLCHYRRFLSPNKELSNFEKAEHSAGCITVNYLTESSLCKYKLDEENLRKEIDGNDAVFMKPISLSEFNIKSNYEAMKKAPFWHNMEWVDKAIAILKKKYPEMSDVADEYLYKYPYSYLYNCFVMKKEIFYEFCSWMFDILFELEKQIDLSHASSTIYRTCGTTGEHFFGIWVLWMKKNGYKINELPLLFINHPEKSEDTKPAFDKNNIAVACSSSDEYVPYLSVYLQSIIENVSFKNNYDIVVFERGITSENKKKLLRMVKTANNISLRFVNPMELLSAYDLKFPAHYSLECYFRLCSPLILKNYEKIIFTDIDLVFQKDPALLYQTNVEGYPLAACKDLLYGAMLNMNRFGLKDYEEKVLKLEKPYEYFNTGVMVINIREFLRNNYSYELLELVSKITFRILEQDGLNYYFKTNIKYIDTAWNYAVPIKNYVEVLKSFPKDFEKQYNIDAEDPNIIHWAGHGKPWLDATEAVADIWWQYAHKTPFYEEILARLIDFKMSKCNQQQQSNNKLLYISSHFFRFKLKKLRYRLMKHITFGKKKEKYKAKYKALKTQIKAAHRFVKELKKSIK